MRHDAAGVRPRLAAAMQEASLPWAGSDLEVRAAPVDHETCRYGLASLDLPHATPLISTPWDSASHAALSVDEVAAADADWSCEMGPAATARRPAGVFGCAVRWRGSQSPEARRGASRRPPRAWSFHKSAVVARVPGKIESLDPATSKPPDQHAGMIGRSIP